MTDDSSKHPFAEDRPIGSKDEDVLGRYPFAASIGKAISGWKHRDSLVIALYGPWGSGKSSIKNMALRAISELPDQPLIIDFNPWQWAGEERLTQAFFQEVGRCLGRDEKSASSRQRAKTWALYSAYLKTTANLAEGFAHLAKWALLTFGAATLVGGGISIVSGLPPWLTLLAGVPLAMAAALKWGKGLSEEMAALFEKRAQFHEESLPELKSRLSKLFEPLTHPVVVVMDDVDRLTPLEIRQLFRLVKANADLPNVVYFLLFQRDLVEEALDQEMLGHGKGYLEKIVQVGVDVPALQRAQLYNVLFRGLDKQMTYQGVGRHFDQQRWGNIFHGGFRSLFDNIRDVKRFLSSLSFQVSMFLETGSFEVNFIDLLVLEALRVFEPDVYHALPTLKRELVHAKEHRDLFGDPNKDPEYRALHSIFAEVDPKRVDAAKELVAQLFPLAAWAFDGPQHGESLDRWYRELRVCHPDVFDRYFQLAVSDGDVSQADIDRIIGAMDDREKLVTELKALDKKGLLVTLLLRFEEYKTALPLENALPFITGLFDIGDLLPMEPIPLSSVRPEMNACRIIFHYLKRERDGEKRAAILESAMRTTSGLFLPVMKTALEERRKDREEREDSYLLTEQQFERLRDLSLEKIRAASKDGRLANHVKMLHMLYRWGQWSSFDEPRAWVANLIQTEDGLLAFLKACRQVTTSQGMNDYVPKRRWVITLKDLEEFADVQEVQDRVRSIDKERLNEDDRLTIDVFAREMRRRDQGREGDFYTDEDDE